MSGIAFTTVGSSTNPTTQSTTSSSTTGQNSATSSASNTLTEQDFIQLLVAQLQDQNPTSPTNPQDLANEFSDMAMVSGITSLTQEASQIQSSGAPGQLAQAAGLIGKTVAVPGNTLTPSSAGTAEGAFTLGSAATRAMVSIFNASGNQVGSIPVSSPSTGLNTFQWNGGHSGQVYHFAVAAANSSGSAVQATTYSAAQVSAVDVSQSSPSVTVAGTTTPVPLSNIAGLLGD
jgi:flagellar basal-body rod modification protein FlgD